MDNNGDGNQAPSPSQPPDREVVARMAVDLARLKDNPAAEENLEAARSDIQNQGLTAFFHAAVQTMAAEQARAQAEAGPGGMPGAAAPAAVPAAGLPAAGAELPFGVPAAIPGFPIPGDQGKLRQTWQDCIQARSTQPLSIFYPTTLADLRSILQQAEQKNCRVKAVGSGHAFTDVAATRDFLVETHGLNRPNPQRIDASELKQNVDSTNLFETEAGITVCDLNEALWNAGFGLENMGGFDGQTIAGVISTSTHGSGLRYGPLPSQVVSMTIVSAGGRTVRVEPADGITDPDIWQARHPDIELKQDDDWFNACQVSMGCMGVIYSLVLRVKPRYFLHEQRSLSDWFTVREELRDGQVLRDNDHYEVLVNPYSTLPGGNHTCLITRRNPAPEPASTPISPTRNILIEMVSRVPGNGQVLLGVLNSFPRLTPDIIDGAMKAIVGDYTDRSYRVYNIGAANDIPAYGSEIAFSLNNFLDSVEHILAVAGQRQAVGQSYLNSPFSLRFVQASPAHLSMMQGSDTCMVELISLNQTVGGKELLQALETELYSLGGRPHWGLVNFLTGAGGLIDAMYPLLSRWQAVRCELDPEGVFANSFTERCGLTPLMFGRGG